MHANKELTSEAGVPYYVHTDSEVQDIHPRCNHPETNQLGSRQTSGRPGESAVVVLHGGSLHSYVTRMWDGESKTHSLCPSSQERRLLLCSPSPPTSSFAFAFASITASASTSPPQPDRSSSSTPSHLAVSIAFGPCSLCMGHIPVPHDPSLPPCLAFLVVYRLP